MIVTIVGGSGFIGSRLCQRLYLNKSFDFHIIDKSISYLYPNKFTFCDISNPIDQSLLFNSSVLINLAAEHRDDVYPIKLYYDTNVQGARNICKVAIQNNIQKIIFTSSVAVYGFATVGTDESGKVSPFNDYGRSKLQAEQVYKEWQGEDPQNRTLIIVRPTVVFGERNRGNVFNLLRQIVAGKFIMIGNGFNRKSMAYVENVAAFLEYSLTFKPGVHIYNYIDRPNFTMNELVSNVNKLLGKTSMIKFKLPFFLGLLIGFCFDLVAKIAGKKFPISAIRVKKFCANSVYESAVESTGFTPPVRLIDAIDKTIRFEFIEDHKNKHVFYSE